MSKASGFKSLMLIEHFRCLPEIIGFSNNLSYDGRIKPLRDSSTTSILPPVVEYRVEGGVLNNKKVNESEVNHIVSLVQAFLDMNEYKGQTIGVISMLGDEQSRTIERKLMAIVDPKVYEERRIQCGTPPQFQGDERDVIIMSLVAIPNETGGPIRLLSEDGKNDINRKRYNVAASRAKNQLWVVHSLNTQIDLKPDDLRYRLIKYAENPNNHNDSLLNQSESHFESGVMKFLLNESYLVKPQYNVGSYRIDMVIQYEDKKVALECDGEKYHTSDNLAEDLERQAILERMGWRFIRIRGIDYYRNPEQTMKNLIESLSKYEIFPTISSINSEKKSNVALLNKVKIKASSFRNKGYKEDVIEEDITSEDDFQDEQYKESISFKKVGGEQQNIRVNEGKNGFNSINNDAFCTEKVQEVLQINQISDKSVALLNKAIITTDMENLLNDINLLEKWNDKEINIQQKNKYSRMIELKKEQLKTLKNT